MKPTSLLAALQHADMLEIDGLYAWEFTLADTPADAAASTPLLQIHCIDGRVQRQWRFSLGEVGDARYIEADDSWQLDSATTCHQLKCFTAFRGDNDDADEPDEAAND